MPDLMGNSLAEFAQEVEAVAGTVSRLTSANIQASKLEEDQKLVIWALTFSAYRSTHACCLLVAHGSVFDADVLVRTVIEATLNVLRLLENPEHFTDRYEEYAKLIPAISSRRWARHLTRAIESSERQGRPASKFLTEALAHENSASHPAINGSRRKEIEDAWSPINIAVAMMTGPLGSYLNGLPMNYMRSSSIVHASYRGVVAAGGAITDGGAD